MNYHTFLSFHGFNMTSQVDNVDWFPITSGTYKYINNLVKTSNANWLHFLLWISDFFFLHHVLFPGSDQPLSNLIRRQWHPVILFNNEQKV
jgi:hypothetical protein